MRLGKRAGAPRSRYRQTRGKRELSGRQRDVVPADACPFVVIEVICDSQRVSRRIGYFPELRVKGRFAVRKREYDARAVAQPDKLRGVLPGSAAELLLGAGIRGNRFEEILIGIVVRGP